MTFSAVQLAETESDTPLVESWKASSSVGQFQHDLTSVFQAVFSQKLVSAFESPSQDPTLTPQCLLKPSKLLLE